MARRLCTAAATVGILAVVLLLARSVIEDDVPPPRDSTAVSGQARDSATPLFASEAEVASAALSRTSGPSPDAPGSSPIASSSGATSRPTSTSANPHEADHPRRERAARQPRVGDGKTRPGGSFLYSGEAFQGRVPPGLEGADAARVKAAQLERSADVANKRGTIVGRIEQVDVKTISGWAYAWDEPEVPVTVDVFVDGKLAATVSAQERRAGFAPGDPSNALNARGWSCPSPASLADGDKHWVTALGSKPGSPAKHELMDSPRAFGGAEWPQGHLAFANEHVVYGWAVDPARREAPVSVEVLADGKSMARVKTRGPAANQAVLDEARAALGDGAAQVGLVGADAQAFVLTSKEGFGAKWIQVRVAREDGTLAREVAGSPRNVSDPANKLPFGGVSFVSDAQVSGWAVDDDVSPGAISVDVVIDGTYFGRIPADKKFDALPNFTTIREPLHAFTFTPPETYRDGKTHAIQFYAVNQPEGPNPELEGSPAQFVGKRNAVPQGWLDGAGPGGANGWAYDPDAGANPIQVEIWVDGVLHATVDANASRPDLVPIVAPEPTHGFGVALPATLSDGKLHVVRAFARDSQDGPRQELSGSPKEINAQRPWLGVSVRDSSTAGLTIESVIPDSPAAAGGLLAGDVIRSFDGNDRKVDAAAFVAWLGTKEIGEEVVFELWRDPGSAPPNGSRRAVVKVGGR